MRISTEHSARLYDDDAGYWYAVEPDGELGGCVLSYSDGDAGAEVKRLGPMPWEMAVALANAILEVAARNKPTGE